MSNANRDYAIVYDVKNSSLVLSRPLSFYITDKNTSNIFVKLVTKVSIGNGIDQYTDIENASNYVLTMRVIKPNNEVKSLEATQHEPENIFQFDLTEDFKDIPGKYICELTISTIVSARQELITSDPFNYEVKRSILSNVGEIIETVDTTVEKLLNDLDTTKAELSSQIKDIANYEIINVKKYGAKGDGINDDTEIIQHLLDNHKKIFFPSGIYLIKTLKLNSYNEITGEGYASQLKQVDGFDGHFITLKTDTTHSTTIEKIYINGNGNNQTSFNDGIHYINSVDEILDEQLIDHYHIIRDVHVEKVKGNGAYFYYTREITVDNLKVRQCEKDGIVFNGSDSFFSNCTVSTSKNGYCFISGATKIINCKAFVNKVGFLLDGEYCNSMLISNCDTQSNDIGFKLRNAKNNILTGIVSNNENVTSLIVENSKFNTITGLIDNTLVTNKEGIKMVGKSFGNTINFRASTATPNTFLNKLLIDKYYSSNSIIVNNQEYVKNIFNYSMIDSIIQNKYNTMDDILVDGDITFINKFSDDTLTIEITSNREIQNYGSVRIATDFIPLPPEFKLSASAECSIVNGNDITANVCFSCYNNTDNIGKMPFYLQEGDNNIVDGMITNNTIIEGTKKIKVLFAFDTKQIVGIDELKGYKFTIKHPKISIV